MSDAGVFPSNGTPTQFHVAGADAQTARPMVGDIAPRSGVAPEAQTTLELPTPSSGSRLDDAYEAMPASEKKDILEQVGKDLAKTVGASVIAQMLHSSGLSGREIQKQYGFDHTALSRIARGESVSGPTLWKIFALAAALGFTINLSAERSE